MTIFAIINHLKDKNSPSYLQTSTFESMVLWRALQAVTQNVVTMNIISTRLTHVVFCDECLLRFRFTIAPSLDDDDEVAVGALISHGDDDLRIRG
jgi:hypothetical protein